MKFIGETLSYLKKSFWLLAAVIAVPSIAACFLSTPYWEVSFVTTIEQPFMRASQTFGIIFGDSWRYVWPVVVVSALQIFASALAMSSIDRHFRTGKLSLRSPWRLINYSVFSIFLGVVIMCVTAVLLRFVLFGLVMLVQAIAQAAGFNAGATIAIISVIAVALFVVHVIIITPALYLAPIMFIYGYGFRDAAGMSFKLIAGKKVFVGLILPMLLCAGLQLLIGFLNVHSAIGIACNFVIFLVTNVYVVAYVAVTFYKISGLDRRDIKPYAAFVLPSVPPVKKPDAAANSEKPQDEVAESADKKPSKKTAAQKSDDKSGEKPTKQQTTKQSASAKNNKGTAKSNKNKVPDNVEAAGEGGDDGV